MAFVIGESRELEEWWKRTLLDRALLAFVAEEDLEFLLVLFWELGEGICKAGLLREGIHFERLRRW